MTHHIVTIPNSMGKTIAVPDGLLHLEEVKARGWSKQMIADLLPEDLAVLIDALPGASRRCWRVEDVETAEATPGFAEILNSAATAAVQEAADRETAKVAAQEAEAVRIAAQVPRKEGGYTVAECVGTAYLKARGWTPAHIERLLGESDCTLRGVGRYGSASHYWSRERMETAERSDPRLMKRLAPFQEAYAAKQQAKQQAAAAAKVEREARGATERAAVKAERERSLAQAAKQRPIFRRGSVGWVVVGPGLTVGAEVTVTKRDGATSTVTVTHVLSETDGVVTAAFTQAGRRASGQNAEWGSPERIAWASKFSPYRCPDCEDEEDTGETGRGCPAHRDHEPPITELPFHGAQFD